MKFSIEEDGEVVTVSLREHIDLEWSGAVRDVLFDALGRAHEVRLDMSGVDMIDSSGVSALLDGFEKARKVGKRVRITAASHAVRRVLQLARLETVLLDES